MTRISSPLFSSSLFDPLFIKMVNDIIPIDIELVKRLRFEGKYLEAWRLVKAYQDSMKKNWKEVRKKKGLFVNQRIRMYRKTKNLCVRCGKPKGDTKRTRCDFCRRRERLEKRRKKKNNGITRKDI